MLIDGYAAKVLFLVLTTKFLPHFLQKKLLQAQSLVVISQ